MSLKGRGVRGLRGEIKKLIQYGEELGFAVNLTPGGHFKFFQRGCEVVFVSQSPSDQRAYKNARNDIRRSASASSVKKCG